MCRVHHDFAPGGVGGAGAPPQLLAVEADDPAGDMQPAAPSLCEGVAYALAFGDLARIDRNFLMDGDGAVRSAAVRDQPQRAGHFLARIALLFVARRDALYPRDNPDLEKMDRLGLGAVELAMGDASPSRHRSEEHTSELQSLMRI